ncbi:MAG: aldolase/citrate lyase family protein [Planctomycetaceae bacterium]|nr:aldolase/citrate lyase family protein [Planctomycetaceae bacterium]
MVPDTLVKRFKAGETLYGTFADFLSPDIVEMFGLAGFDFTVVDCEHGASGPDRAVDMVRAGTVTNMPTMVRVPNALPSTILKHLDIGSAGIMVPLVHTPDIAKTVAEAARYYPRGRRGYAGMRSANWGFLTVEEHIERCNANTFVQVQAESVEAVKNIDAIASIDGIDSIFIGTFDLSQSLGIPGQVNDAKMVDAIGTVLKAVKNAGKVAGIFAGTFENAKRYADMGFQFIIYAGDVIMIHQAATAAVKALKGK